jgi:hypothetical protein
MRIFKACIAILLLAAAQRTYGFALLEALGGYTNRPPELTPGLHRLPLAYPGQIWAPREAGSTEAWPPRWPRPEDETSVRALAKKWALRDPKGLVCLDIEHWRVDRSAFEAQQTQEAVLKVLGWMRDESPGLRLGIFGMIPTHMMDRDLAGPESAIIDANDRVAGIYGGVDEIYVDAYSMGWQLPHWQQHVEAVVAQCRRFKKPIYLFIRPRRADRADAEVYGADEWMAMLQTCSKIADGAVIWEYGQGAAWDPSPGWFQATKSFVGNPDGSKAGGS